MVSKKMPRPLVLSPVVLEPQHVLPPTRILNSSLARHSVFPAVYPKTSHLPVKMSLRDLLPSESSPDHHPLLGPFLPLAVTCPMQLVVKCSYSLSLPWELCLRPERKSYRARVYFLLLCTTWCRLPSCLQAALLSQL